MRHRRIGDKIKELRKERGLTQIELAERIDVSYQQVQKYEKGITQISVHRLLAIADALEVPVTAFIEEPSLNRVSEEPDSYASEVKFPLRLTREEVKLVNLFRKISNKKVREGLLKQLKGVVELELKK